MNTLTPPPPTNRHIWASRALSWSVAFLAGCPVLANLASTWTADGDSFAVTASITCAGVALMLLAIATIGLPVRPVARMSGVLLTFCIIAALFWMHWSLLNLLSPSPQPQMHYQLYQAAIWMLLPMFLMIIWRDWIDPWMVIRCLIVLFLIFVVGLSLRWLLGLGFYQSGRWHAGKSLEAIRCGRYAAMALWVFALSALCPKAVISGKLKLLCLLGIPIAAVMMIAANARGPWLSLVITVVLTVVPLCRLLAVRILHDVRVLAVLLLAIVGIATVVAVSLTHIESDFGRLLTLTNDGGSASGRLLLIHNHLQIITASPLTLVSGDGYGRGYFYPHNIMIEALCDGGVICAGLLSAMVCFTVYIWWTRCDPLNVPRMLLIGLFFLNLTGSMVSGSIATDLTWYFPCLLFMEMERHRRPLAVAATRSALHPILPTRLTGTA